MVSIVSKNVEVAYSAWVASVVRCRLREFIVRRIWPLLLTGLTVACSKNKLGFDGEDRPPVVEIMVPTGDETLYSDIPVDLEITVLDVEDAPGEFDIEWESDVQGRLSVDMDVTGDTSLEGAARLDAGLHLLKVSVRDTAGNLATDEVIAEVGPPNEPPTCRIVSPSAGSVGNPGETVSLTAQVGDVNEPASNLYVEWGSTVDGTLGQSTVSSEGVSILPINTLSPGDHTIQLLVRDELNELCTDLVVYTIGGGPEITILSPVDDAIIDEGQPVEFAGHVSDSIDAASELRIQWRSDMDGLLNDLPPDSDGTMDFQIDELSVGFHTITLFASNSESMSNDETVTIRINALPTQPLVEIEPDSPDSSHDLTATITEHSTDADGDAVDYRYTWYRNGSVFLEGSSATIPKDSTARGDAWRVVVTPSDGLSEGEPGQAEVFISNTPPQVVEVSISPDPATTTDSFLCTYTGASDWDGDAVSVSYQWTVGEEGVPVTTAELPSDWTARDQEVYCDVTPHDGFTAGAPTRSNVVTIDNSAPHVVSAWIAPEAVRAWDTPTCEWGGFSDPDGDEDESIVTWYVNDALVGTGTVASGSYVRGDTLSCVVTPSDGSLEGEPVTASVVVLNTAPSYESLVMTPLDADVDDVIHCGGWGYYDADGDSDSSYIIWDINGGVWGVSGSISGAFVGGDVVTCTLVPSDGIDEGVAISATQTIGNTAPSIDSVRIEPDDPTGYDPLYCEASGFSDVDGDDDLTSYSWYRNDLSLGVHSQWLAAGYTEPGDIIMCRATPWDGTSTGTPRSASVVIRNTPPTVTGGFFSPSTIRTNSTARINAYATDADDDDVSMSYSWYVNGFPVGTDVDSLEGSVHFDKGDSITVVVTPSDPTESGEPYEFGPIEVANSAPSGLVATVSPDDPDEGEDALRCLISETPEDPDGDPVSYSVEWYRRMLRTGSSRVLHTSGLYTDTILNDSVEATETAGGEEWTCELTVTDDDGGASMAEASVSIAGWIGRTSDLPALSCAEVLANYPDAPDGLYFLRPMDETFQGYCDMTTDGGGWTLVAYAPTNFGVPTEWSWGTAVNRDGCVLMSSFCRMSDDEINTILDLRSDTILDLDTGNDDRFRLLAPGLPNHGAYYWDTPLNFYTTTGPSTSAWWRVAKSYRGSHSLGCAPSDARGVGHEPTAGGCSASDHFGPLGTDRVYFMSSGGTSVGGAVDTSYSWYAK